MSGIFTHEHKAFHHAVQAAWGTAQPGVSNYNTFKERSGIRPWNPPPVVIMDGVGAGTHFPNITDIIVGRGGVALDCEWLGTKRAFSDAYVLLFQNNASSGDYQYTLTLPTTPVVSKFATIGCDDPERADAAIDKAYYADSCLLRSVDLRIPQAPPGDAAGGFVTLGLSWIGRQGVGAAFDFGTVTRDTASPYDVGDVIFSIGDTTSALTAKNILSMNLLISNGAYLLPGATASSTTVGASLGRWDVSGSIMCFDEGVTSGALSTQLYTSLGSIDERQCRLDIDTGSEDGPVEINWTMQVSGPPTRGDVGGIATCSFPFRGIYTATANTEFSVLVSNETASLYYEAP
jgi:hypothetical protein